MRVERRGKPFAWEPCPEKSNAIDLLDAEDEDDILLFKKRIYFFIFRNEYNDLIF